MVHTGFCRVSNVGNVYIEIIGLIRLSIQIILRIEHGGFL